MIVAYHLHYCVLINLCKNISQLSYSAIMSYAVIIHFTVLPSSLRLILLGESSRILIQLYVYFEA